MTAYFTHIHTICTIHHHIRYTGCLGQINSDCTSSPLGKSAPASQGKTLFVSCLTRHEDNDKGKHWLCSKRCYLTWNVHEVPVNCASMSIVRLHHIVHKCPFVFLQVVALHRVWSKGYMERRLGLNFFEKYIKRVLIHVFFLPMVKNVQCYNLSRALVSF